jgi:histidinol-phosphatase
MNAREIRVSAVSELEAASFSYSSVGGWDRIDKRTGFDALLQRVWRTRAYGDFWSYMLLAEGAVDIAAEPDLELWDMAALDVIVREAGGRFTGLDGRAGPWSGNALATNARLHDAALAYLGHFPDGESDEHEPADESGHDEPGHEPRHRDNVLAFPPPGGERTMDPAE